MLEIDTQSKQPHGDRLDLIRLTKNYLSGRGVDDISLSVPGGTFVSLLGPSGSGKTTTLNLIAGFLKPDAGDILIDGRSITTLPPNKRNIGMVFQSYALFPHMTVAENINYPLRMRSKLSRADARSRVDEIAKLMQLSELIERYPRQLSGGQQQRVAMARALVSRPYLLLMDEPLGALDKNLREQMQFEIKRIHRTAGTTVVYVTHDQVEALTMSDIVVVMNHGSIAQIGSPRTLYEQPNNCFVAGFIGDSNLIPGLVVEIVGDQLSIRVANNQLICVPRGLSEAKKIGDQVVVMLRPEDIWVEVMHELNSAPDALKGKVIEISFQGHAYRLSVAVGDELITLKLLRSHFVDIAEGDDVLLRWRQEASVLVPK